MIKMKWHWTLAISIYLAVSQSALAGTGQPDSGLIGQWQCQSSTGAAVMIFEANRLTINGRPMLYRLLPGGILRTRDASGTNDYRYALNGNRLTMSYSDGWQMQCVKSGQPRMSQRNNPSPSGRGGNRPPSGDEHLLRGMYCHWSGSSGGGASYSHTTKAAFDGRGRFQYVSSASYSGGGSMYSGGDPETGAYRVKGNNIYLQFADGSRGMAMVYTRRGNGSIESFKYSGDIFAPRFCR